MEDAAEIERIALKRSENLAKECMHELQDITFLGTRLASATEGHLVASRHRKGSLGITQSGGNHDGYQDGYTSCGLIYSRGLEITNRGTRPHSRLKFSLRGAITRLNDLACYLFSLKSRRALSTPSALQAIFFIFILILSCITPSLEQPSKLSSLDKLKSSNSRTFMEQFEIEGYEDERHNAKQFEFPELVAHTGRLFQYQIPPEAFSKMTEIHKYQVCG